MKVMCSQAALFHCTQPTDIESDLLADPSAVHFLAEDFRLPFPFIAIEDEDTCTFLFRRSAAIAADGDECDAAKTERGISFDSPMKFISWRMWTREEVDEMGGHIPDAWICEGAVGHLNGIYPEDGMMRVHGLSPMFAVGGKKTLLRFRDAEDPATPSIAARAGVPDILQDNLSHAALAVEEMRRAMLPTNWIFKKVNEKARPIKKGSIPRSDQRTRYIIVSNKEVNRIIRMPNPDNKRNPITPHRRRGHWKRLMSERYRWKRGQMVWVKPAWVGPKEFVRSGERYEVCLDV